MQECMHEHARFCVYVCARVSGVCVCVCARRWCVYVSVCARLHTAEQCQCTTSFVTATTVACPSSCPVN